MLGNLTMGNYEVLWKKTFLVLGFDKCLFESLTEAFEQIQS